MQLCGFEAGLDRPFFLLAGPCVLEGEQMAIDIAGHLKEVTGELGIPYVFKASYDKANRLSLSMRLKSRNSFLRMDIIYLLILGFII